MSDIARIRFANTERLLQEFLGERVVNPDLSEVRGLESRFAEQLGISKNYWSALKKGSRQIGEKLARQFEARCARPHGWLDIEPLQVMAPSILEVTPQRPQSRRVPAAKETGAIHPAHPSTLLPANVDESFVVGLLLTCFRRDPQATRQAVAQMVGDVMAGRINSLL